jgi:hypothetical protein
LTPRLLGPPRRCDPAPLTALANAHGVELSALVNDLLRKDIELIELGR